MFGFGPGKEREPCRSDVYSGLTHDLNRPGHVVDAVTFVEYRECGLINAFEGAYQEQQVVFGETLPVIPVFQDVLNLHSRVERHLWVRLMCPFEN